MKTIKVMDITYSMSFHGRIGKVREFRKTRNGLKKNPKFDFWKKLTALGCHIVKEREIPIKEKWW